MSPGCAVCRCHHAGHAAARCPAVAHAGRSGPGLDSPASAAGGPAAVLEAEGRGWKDGSLGKMRAVDRMSKIFYVDT